MDAEKDERLNKVAEIVSRVVKPKAPPTAATHALSGAGNIAGNGNTVVFVQAPSEAAPGQTPLSGEHKEALDDLVSDIVLYESMQRGKPYRVSDVRRKFHRALNLGPDLKEADFARIDRYLRGWLAKVACRHPTPGHDPKWRSRRVARILKRCEALGRTGQLEQLLAVSYGATVLIELGDAQLDEVFRLVFTWV